MTRNPILLASLFLVCALSPVLADTPTAVQISISKNQTPLSDVLTSLSKQTKTPLLADDTVIDFLGTADIKKPTLESMLKTLQTLSPGLTWQRIYLPKDASLPSANALSDQVRTLKSVAATGLVIADPSGQNVSFTKTQTPDTDTPVAPVTPDGMRLVYLLTNEDVRARRQASAASDAKPTPTATQPQEPTSQAYTGIQNLGNALSQMTPQQQAQVLPSLYQLMRNLDPSVRQMMRQPRGRGGNRGGQPGTGAQPGNGGG